MVLETIAMIGLIVGLAAFAIALAAAFCEFLSDGDVVAAAFCLGLLGFLTLAVAGVSASVQQENAKHPAVAKTVEVQQ